MERRERCDVFLSEVDARHGKVQKMFEVIKGALLRRSGLSRRPEHKLTLRWPGRSMRPMRGPMLQQQQAPPAQEPREVPMEEQPA